MTSSSGDEVPSPVVVPDVVGVLPSKSTGAAGHETPTNPVNPPAPAAPAAAPSAVIPDANTPIAPLLRDALQGDTARMAFEPFYSARNYEPLWITNGKVNERALAAMAYLARCRR